MVAMVDDIQKYVVLLLNPSLLGGDRLQCVSFLLLLCLYSSFTIFYYVLRNVTTDWE